MRCDQADDAFAIGRGEADAQRFAAAAQPVHPQQTVRVQHDLHYVGVVQSPGDVWPLGRAQQAHATLLRQRDRHVMITQYAAHDGTAPDSSSAGASLGLVLSWVKSWL